MAIGVASAIEQEHATTKTDAVASGSRLMMSVSALAALTVLPALILLVRPRFLLRRARNPAAELLKARAGSGVG